MKSEQTLQKKEEASASLIKVVAEYGSQPLVECFLDGNLLIRVVDTQSDVTLVPEEVAAKLKLTIDTTDVLNIKGYGSISSGQTQGSVEVKLTLTNVELQMKIHIVANHLQTEDILIGKDVTENLGLIGVTKKGKWWFFMHSKDDDILPSLEEEKIVLRAKCTTVIPPQTKGICHVYTTDARL